MKQQLINPKQIQPDEEEKIGDTTVGTDENTNFNDKVQKEIIFATQMTKAKSDYYLEGDPVSMIFTNIPSFKGGRINPWIESDTSKIAVQDAEGK